MSGTFRCACYKCGHSWSHDSRQLAREGGAKCPSCGLWLPVADEARDRVDFVAAIDRAGGGPILSGEDFVEAVESIDRERRAVASVRSSKRWWQIWK